MARFTPRVSPKPFDFAQGERGLVVAVPIPHPFVLSAVEAPSHANGEF
jgi:hypothetical protein